MTVRGGDLRLLRPGADAAETLAHQAFDPVLAAGIGLDPDIKPRRILSRYQSRDDTVAALTGASV